MAIDEIAERLRQRRAAALADLARGQVVDAGAFAAGARVFDPATGLDGTITGAGLADRLQRHDVRIQLDDGREVIRGATDLIIRPRLE